jgi:hypothetical protein
MRKQSFTACLAAEVESARLALLAAYQERDRVLYVEAAPLRKKYMDIFGVVEDAVLRAELELHLLERKRDLIQIALNRREPVDLAAIEKMLEEEKAELLRQLESEDRTSKEMPELTEDQMQTMQRQYREINRSFHPSMHPEISDTQRELFEKAQTAYRDQDPEAMKLVYDMLFEPVDLGALQFAMQEISRADPLSPRQSFAKFAHEMETDYGLAKELYDCFLPLEEDRVVSSALDIYTAERHLVEEEIAEIRKGFPFNAAEVLSDPAKQEEYMMSLKLRAKQCEIETKQVKDTITELLRGTIHG